MFYKSEIKLLRQKSLKESLSKLRPEGEFLRRTPDIAVEISCYHCKLVCCLLLANMRLGLVECWGRHYEVFSSLGERWSWLRSDC